VCVIAAPQGIFTHLQKVGWHSGASWRFSITLIWLYSWNS